MLRRSDKRKDRVEISPEQLSHASTQAERLGMLTSRKCPMRILGWYHSHPHITVWPSHVDVQTQAMYQMMDPGFVGLIFSCFNDDAASGTGQIQMTCFQSQVNFANEYNRVDVPVEIIPSESISDACLEALEQLPDILGQEEQEVFQRTLSNLNNDLLTTVHNGAIYTKSLCHVIEVMCGPLMQTFENRLERNKRRTEELSREKEELERRLEAIRNA